MRITQIVNTVFSKSSNCDSDAPVLRLGAVEPHEILAIDGEDAAVGSDGEAEDDIVFDGLIGLSRLVSG